MENRMDSGRKQTAMKRFCAFWTVCILLLCITPLCAWAAQQINYGTLLLDMLEAYEEGKDAARIDADVQAIGEDMAYAIAEHWKSVYLNPDYQLLLYGRDDPDQIPVSRAHAFIVLGYELENGEMTDELKGRCEAAACAAAAFPDSILVCSGGATGKNNPDRHTEAGLMKAYLSGPCGIPEDRILIDERAKTTVENAVNTLAILREKGIASMTLVTSSYHQKWAQVLYNALAEQYREKYGYSADMIGNFCYDIVPSQEMFLQDDRIAIRQLGGILGLTDEQMNRFPRPARK